MPKQRKHSKPAPGKLVTVDNRKIHVYSEGEGENTYVFLSGSGTRYPTNDFKPLWSLLVDDSKIVVVERAGYGWSDISDDVSRDIGTVLSETREALRQADILPPYILVPHSLSGIEAVYWAQTHPSEVKAIIGLDVGIADYYVSANFRLGLVNFLGKIGIFTSDMMNEVDYIRSNAEKILAGDFPTDVPVYFFISNSRPKGVNWGEMLVEYSKRFTINKHMFTNCGHYVHRFKPQEIANEIKTFMNEQNKTT